MFKSAIFILFAMLAYNTSAQLADTSVLNKAHLKRFLTDIRKSELSKEQIIIIDKPVFVKSSTISFYSNRDQELLDFSDSNFIVQQILQHRNWIWDSTLIDDAIFVTNETVKKIFKNNKEGSGWLAFTSKFGPGKKIYTMSIPIFSKNMAFCIVEINYSCGDFCGNYCVLAFKLVDNHWKLFKELECSAS